MRIYLIVLLALISTFQLVGQQVYSSERLHISFESPEILEYYVEVPDTSIGYENDNYAVDFVLVPLEEESEGFINNIKYAAREIAEDMGFENIVDGFQLAYIKKSFYVVTHEKEENLRIPVFVIAIINEERKIAYEATVYCYNLNKTAGEKIANSFKLIK